jgi:hypothetical protein
MIVWRSRVSGTERNERARVTRLSGGKCWGSVALPAHAWLFWHVDASATEFTARSPQRFALQLAYRFTPEFWSKTTQRKTRCRTGRYDVRSLSPIRRGCGYRSFHLSIEPKLTGCAQFLSADLRHWDNPGNSPTRPHVFRTWSRLDLLSKRLRLYRIVRVKYRRSIQPHRSPRR